MGPLGLLTTKTKKGVMKKLIVCSSAVALLGMLTGCVSPMDGITGIRGGIYTDVTGALLATSNSGSSKKGEASSEGIICVSTGDSSIHDGCPDRRFLRQEPPLELIGPAIVRAGC